MPKFDLDLFEAWDELNKINGLDYSIDDAQEIVKQYINEVMKDEDFNIVDIQFNGSRLRGDNRQDSDLDVVVEYIGGMKEYVAFNILNEDPLYIDSIKIDINPIRKEESGTMKSYMEKSHKYDKEHIK